jgi:streptomycin 6-kinase
VTAPAGDGHDLVNRCRELTARWRLHGQSSPTRGRRSVRLAVIDEQGLPATLLISSPGRRCELTALALRHWAGRGAVRLLRADPAVGALLVERAGPARLDDLPDDQALRSIAAGYSLLHIPAGPQYPRLSARARLLAAELAALPRSASLPHRLVAQGLRLSRAFADDPSCDGVLLHTNLRPTTMLAATRHPWLAVGPVPMSGDPHYEPVATLLDDDLGPGARGQARRRLELIVEACGLDHARVRDWVIVGCLHDALRALAADPRQRLPDTAGRLTRAVTLAKAVQD